MILMIIIIITMHSSFKVTVTIDKAIQKVLYKSLYTPIIKITCTLKNKAEQVITLSSLICSCISRLCTPTLFLQKDHVSLAYETNEPATTTHHRVFTGGSASWRTAF